MTNEIHSYDSIQVSKMSQPKYIIVHCSDSNFGDAELIHKWHIESPNNFKKIGYHYVILNGCPRKSTEYISKLDGEIESGRKEYETGSHCLGYNSNSIGICCIGKTFFTSRQLVTLISLINSIRSEYNIPLVNVLGHYETLKANGKTCPNFNMITLRTLLEQPDLINNDKIFVKFDSRNPNKTFDFKNHFE